MPMFARIKSLRDSLLRKPRLEQELDAELRVFVEELADRYVDRGLTREAAEQAALAELGGAGVAGGVALVKGRVRDARIGNGIETTIGDARHAWRGLWRTPSFAAVTILTLGIGIGATTAIFSLVHALLLEDLPYRDAQQLVIVWGNGSSVGYPRAPLSGPDIEDLRHRSTRFTGFGGIWLNTAVLTGDDPEQLRIGLVTPEFFRVLGASPAIGRTFVDEDIAASASHTILLSDALWRRRFGGDPSIVGRTIQVNHEAATVIGVMPASFRLLFPQDSSVPDDLQAWLLLHRSYVEWPRGQRFLRVIGRMKPGVALADAREEVTSIGLASLRERQGATATNRRPLYAVGLHADDVREMQPTLLALFAGVAILLIVACVNVASLLVARAAARGRETAVRLALGASAGRLFRQYAVEGLVLGLLGGVAGLLMGRACLALLIALRPAPLSRIDAATIDPTVLTFTVAVAIIWGFLLSLAPLAEVRRTEVAHALQGGSRSSTSTSSSGGRGGRCGGLLYQRRAALVICQLALSVVLLVSAGLLVRAFMRLMSVDPGFSADHIITFRLALSGPRFNDHDHQEWPDVMAMNTFSEQFRARLAALPGVTGVGAISHLPYDELPNWSTPSYRENDTRRDERTTADTRAITAGLFEAIGAQLVDGRFFTEHDDVKTTPVAIVDERYAQQMWPGERAIGKHFIGDSQTSGTASILQTVVGVVRHIRHRQPTLEFGGQIYFPVRQAPRNPMAYVVKTADDVDAATLVPRIREALRQLDSTLPIYDVRPLSSYVVDARATRRFTMLLALAFAGCALLLAGLGVYGVTAYAVARRRHEFGIRLALGATSRQVMQLVMRETVRLGAIGLTLGLLGAALAAALLRAQLFGITSLDPIAYIVAVPTLAVAVALATWLPARRATRVSPLESLRAD